MASTIMPDARNIQISGGHFSIVHGDMITLHGDEGRQSEQDKLRDHCAPGALLDSNERFDPPRCAPETRERLIEEILAWINGGDMTASIVWLFGGAGVGKSALAQTVAEICQRQGLLAGSFFFSRTSTADRSDGNRLIPTLVLQLMDAFPRIRPQVEDCFNKHVGIFDRSRRVQFDLLFIQPLISPLTTLQTQSAHPTTPTPTMLVKAIPTTAVSKPLRSESSKPRTFKRLVGRILAKVEKNHPPINAKASEGSQSKSSTIGRGDGIGWPSPRLIVIDGLDECSGEDIQIDLLRILASAIPRFNLPLRFLIASRPEGSISRTINYDEAFQLIDVRKIDLGGDSDSDNDIRRFLTKGFQDIHRSHPLRSLLSPSWPSKDTIMALVQKSSCHFIYASTVMKYIQYPRARPDKRLEVILGLSIPPTMDKPFAQLDVLYSHIFISVDEVHQATIKHAFGILVLASRNMRKFFIETSPAQLDEYLGLQAGEINNQFEPLLSLVVLPDNRDADIQILHASLFDYLLDSSRAGSMYLDLEMTHDLLAKYWLKDLIKYTADFEYVQSQTVVDGNLFGEYLLPCAYFLRHCDGARLSEELQEYLRSFLFLYNVVLHPIFLVKSFSGHGLQHVPILLQLFLTLLLKKEFNDGQHWHSVHTMHIEQRLRSMHNDWDPRLLGMVGETLFEDKILQCRHQIYEAVSNIALVSECDISSTSGILRTFAHITGVAEDTVRRHFMVIFLPRLTDMDIVLCTRYHKYTGFPSDDGNELNCVLRRRFVEYLQRIGGDVDQNLLDICKSAWGIQADSRPTVEC